MFIAIRRKTCQMNEKVRLFRTTKERLGYNILSGRDVVGNESHVMHVGQTRCLTVSVIIFYDDFKNMKSIVNLLVNIMKYTFKHYLK